MSNATPIRHPTPTIHSAETTAPSRSLAPTTFAGLQENSQAASSRRTTSARKTTRTDSSDLVKARMPHVCVQFNKKLCRLYIEQSQSLRIIVLKVWIYFVFITAYCIVWKYYWDCYALVANFVSIMNCWILPSYMLLYVFLAVHVCLIVHAMQLLNLISVFSKYLFLENEFQARFSSIFYFLIETIIWKQYRFDCIFY